MKDAHLGHADTVDLFGYRKWYPHKGIERLRLVRRDALLRLPVIANVTFADVGAAGVQAYLWAEGHCLGSAVVNISRDALGLAPKPQLVHDANTAYTVKEAVSMIVAKWPDSPGAAAEAHRLMGAYWDRHGSD